MQQSQIVNYQGKQIRLYTVWFRYDDKDDKYVTRQIDPQILGPKITQEALDIFRRKINRAITMSKVKKAAKTTGKVIIVVGLILVFILIVVFAAGAGGGNSHSGGSSHNHNSGGSSSKSSGGGHHHHSGGGHHHHGHHHHHSSSSKSNNNFGSTYIFYDSTDYETRDYKNFPTKEFKGVSEFTNYIIRKKAKNFFDPKDAYWEARNINGEEWLTVQIVDHRPDYMFEDIQKYSYAESQKVNDNNAGNNGSGDYYYVPQENQQIQQQNPGVWEGDKINAKQVGMNNQQYQQQHDDVYWQQHKKDNENWKEYYNPQQQVENFDDNIVDQDISRRRSTAKVFQYSNEQKKPSDQDFLNFKSLSDEQKQYFLNQQNKPNIFD